MIKTVKSYMMKFAVVFYFLLVIISQKSHGQNYCAAIDDDLLYCPWIEKLPSRTELREGFVTVEYSVTKMGKPENIRVTASKPREMYEEVAIETIKKWRYKPDINYATRKTHTFNIIFSEQ